MFTRTFAVLEGDFVSFLSAFLMKTSENGQFVVVASALILGCFFGTKSTTQTLIKLAFQCG